LITGDLAFFYDSNILWCKYLKGNLRVIIINNGGGGIFRIIDGARDSHLLEGFIEAKHTMKAEKLVKSYGFPFYGVKTIKELERKLPEFFKPHENKPVFMEISTPPEVNAEQYHNYFKQL
jgi:2-succinyl-5-enolpyruvyl-6-hydroxy-3-cyclohexene-1-carboxylate synthase